MYVSQGLLVGKSKSAPIRGSPLGPGGRGTVNLLLLYRNPMKERATAPTRRPMSEVRNIEGFGNEEEATVLAVI